MVVKFGALISGQVTVFKSFLSRKSNHFLFVSFHYSLY
ncbi:hypothetical protein D1BOALGB6SA_2355 [Olavius sp. associated proteobacterium Delta 1]|nr:hypothetical protein D1BOALGB6SA_2355 [Olavius sp. associated proteobacterium Delta 1]